MSAKAVIIQAVEALSESDARELLETLRVLNSDIFFARENLRKKIDEQKRELAYLLGRLDTLNRQLGFHDALQAQEQETSGGSEQ